MGEVVIKIVRANSKNAAGCHANMQPHTFGFCVDDLAKLGLDKGPVDAIFNFMKKKLIRYAESVPMSESKIVRPNNLILFNEGDKCGAYLSARIL